MRTTTAKRLYSDLIAEHSDESLVSMTQDHFPVSDLKVIPASMERIKTSEVINSINEGKMKNKISRTSQSGIYFSKSKAGLTT